MHDIKPPPTKEPSNAAKKEDNSYVWDYSCDWSNHNSSGDGPEEQLPDAQRSLSKECWARISENYACSHPEVQVHWPFVETIKCEGLLIGVWEWEDDASEGKAGEDEPSTYQSKIPRRLIDSIVIGIHFWGLSI